LAARANTCQWVAQPRRAAGYRARVPDPEDLDYVGICRLHAAYADAVTRRAWSDLDALFLPDADRGLVEHPVDPGRSGGVGRDLGDEEQRVGHGRNVLRRSRGELRQPPRGRVNDRVGEFERRYENGSDGKGNTSARPVRAIDW